MVTQFYGLMCNIIADPGGMRAPGFAQNSGGDAAQCFGAGGRPRRRDPIGPRQGHSASG